MGRRIMLAVGLSLGVHALAVVAVVGFSVLGSGLPSQVDVDVVGMRLDELKDLPLGAAAPGAKPAAPPPVVHAPEVVEKTGSLPSKADKRPDRAGADADDASKVEGTARITDLKQLGPAGARFTMLLRPDRLKGTPYAAPVDVLLQRMPDRRDLLEGTNLDLYEDFDALLISTPNVMDYTLTFLAARHHLNDAQMKAAIDRGAKATNRVVTWRSERRRPWGERRELANAPTATASASRDARIIMLPAPGLVVVTPPAYRALLLAPPPKPPAPDGGADAGASPDAGAPAPSWSALLRRIDAEDTLLPPTGIAMATAVDVLKARGGAIAFMGTSIELPAVLTTVLGVADEPYLDVTAEYADEAAAQRFEAAFPVLQRKLRTNPYVVLGGLAPIVARLQATREGAVVKLRLTTTQDEATRILQLAARALGG
jgi:hypothetical protein